MRTGKLVIGLMIVVASPAASQVDFSAINSSIAANNLMTSQWMTNEIINRDIVP